MAYEPSAIQGWTGKKELDWLYEQARKMKSVVEIGSWKGRSTHALLSGCPGTVTAVDHFLGSANQRADAHKEAMTSDIHAQFMANVGMFPNLQVLKMDSRAAAEHFSPKSVDMVFIDGCHSKEEVLADILAWLPKCRVLLCGHDIGEGGVREALTELGIDFQEPEGSLWEVWLQPEKEMS